MSAMKLTFHLMSTLALSLLLYPFYGALSFLSFLGGFFIDVDHYIYYIMKEKDFDIIKSYRYFSTRSFKDFRDQLFIFHTFEFIIPMVIVSFFSEIAFIITLGLLLHLCADWYQEYSRRYRVKALSILYVMLKKPLKK